MILNCQNSPVSHSNEKYYKSHFEKNIFKTTSIYNEYLLYSTTIQKK